MKIAFVPRSRVDELTKLRASILTKEMAQYSAATAETSLILIGMFDEDDAIVGYVAVNRPQDGHKTPHVEEEWKQACEIRGLMLSKAHRGQGLGSLLMHAALRFAQVSGYHITIASARYALVSWYKKFGFVPRPQATFKIGEVTYVPGFLRVNTIHPVIGHWPGTWELPYQPSCPNVCVHGNGSTEVTCKQIVRADVLDAPFLPSPQVRRACIDAETIRTTPPDPTSLVHAIAEARGVHPNTVLPGPGSSALMYAVFPQWFSEGSKVLLLTPTYAEYPHILHSLGCIVDEVPETVDVANIIRTTGSKYDGIVLVNPNSPSGNHMTGLESVLQCVDITTRVWVDETYIDYVGESASLERFASQSPNVVVCKSMSKCYALSGARVAYLVGNGVQLEAILHPPWWVSRIAQKLAIAALSPESRAYYAHEMKKTRDTVAHMIVKLRECGLDTIGRPVASFITCTCPEDADTLIKDLKKQNVYIRTAKGYPNCVRIAAQSPSKTERMIRAIRETLQKNQVL